MRVTNAMVLRSTLLDLNQSLSRLRASQADLSTGRVIRKMSDDPTRATDAVVIRGDLRRAEQRSRTAADAESRLRLTDSALVSGLDLLTRAKELTVRASNGGVSDPAGRAAIATEMSAIRDEMLSIANTTYLDRPIFNGTAAGAAYDSSSGAYLGNGAAVIREVAAGTTIAANITGEQVFGTQAGPTGDMFAVLERLSTAIAAGDLTSIAAEHVNLDDATGRLSAATAEIGSRAARLDGIRVRASASEADLRERLSTIEDTDLAEGLLGVQANENAYTAALQAASRVMPVSLLDFLR